MWTAKCCLSTLWTSGYNDVVKNISSSHVVSQIDKKNRMDIKNLQSTSNKSLECSLVLMNDLKISGNPLLNVSSAEISVKENDRLSEMKSMLENISIKFNSITGNKDRQPCCIHCGKENQVKQQCFQLKACFKYNKKDHVGKFWKDNKHSYSSAVNASSN